MTHIRFTKRTVQIGVVLVLAAAAVSYYVLFYGVRPGPSFIARLQSGQIVLRDVARVEVLRFNTSGGWPFSEREQDKLERFAITEGRIVESLLSMLRTNSIRGIQHRNHPATLHYGILRFELRSGEFFYLYYTILRDKTGDCASIAANSANSANPNGASAYENKEIVGWFQREDPWFRKQ